MRLRTIGLISILAVGLLAASLPAEAQQAGKVHRIGFLRISSSSPLTSRVAIAFRQGMRELGYVEGQNFVMEYRSIGGRGERRIEIAAELVQLKVDVIVTTPAQPPIRAARQATRIIPIVMAGVNFDPVEAGFVTSLARPGGNITGITSIEADLHPKRLALLKEAFPQISRVAIIWRPTHMKYAIKEVEAVAQALGIQIQSLVRVTGGRPWDEYLDWAFSAISRERPDALLFFDNGLFRRLKVRIMEFTAKRRLPTMGSRSRFVDAGGLMSYGADQLRLFHRAATYVDRILKGAKPGDLPIEQPKTFELVINLKTAKQIGVTISPEILLQATKVIK